MPTPYEALRQQLEEARTRLDACKHALADAIHNAPRGAASGWRDAAMHSIKAAEDFLANPIPFPANPPEGWLTREFIEDQIKRTTWNIEKCHDYEDHEIEKFKGQITLFKMALYALEATDPSTQPTREDFNDIANGRDADPSTQPQMKE